MMHKSRLSLLVALTFSFCCTTLAVAQGTDWTYWRGPQFNGVSTEKNLPDSWNPDGGEGSNLLWKRDDLGSISTPVVHDGLLYLITRHKPQTPEEQEKVVCVDAATGETKWESIWNAYLTAVPDSRVGWSSPTVDPETGYVYALGVNGNFRCLHGKTGKLIWEHALSEEYGLLSTYGGRTNFPIVHEDNIIVSAVTISWGDAAKPCHRYLAFDKYNGQSVWVQNTSLFPEDTTHSAPVLGVFDGQLAMVFAAGDGLVWALQPRTGKVLWKAPLSERGINVSPTILGNRIYCGHPEENIGITEMGALAAFDAVTGELIWKNLEQFLSKSPVVIAGKYLVVCEVKGTMYIVDPNTGKVLNESKGKPGFKLDTVMVGSPLYADGKLYVLTKNGRWWIFKLHESGEGDAVKVEVEVLQQARLQNTSGDGSPIAAQGRLYIPTGNALYCVGKAGITPEADPVPPMADEAPKSEDQVPAQIQVVPAESLLTSGDAQRMDVRVYNAKGQWLWNAEPKDVTFSVAAGGLGEIDATGRYSTNPSLRQSGAAIITAKLGELTGQASVRVTPNLPWSFDFDNGEIPVNWVGIRYRHVPVEFDLFQELEGKNPLAGQMYLYMHSTFTNTGAPALTYDDSTSALRWKGLLQFLRLFNTDQEPRTVEEGQARLDAALNLLVEAKVLKSFTWGTWDRMEGDKTIPTPQLKVVRGDRKPQGNGVMCKISTIPKGTKSQGWIGPINLHDYTIQADVLGAIKDAKLPDIGLIAQRYSLDLRGQDQVLRIRSWAAQDYLSASVPFAWEPNVWYSMKLQASTKGETAQLKAKVWKKGTEEPADWTVSLEDKLPNLIGSPGFLGNANDAEIFYDNVTVTPNEPVATIAVPSATETKPATESAPASNSKPTPETGSDK